MKRTEQNILNQINPSQVFEMEIFAQIKSEAYAFMESSDYDKCFIFADQLEEILKQISPSNEEQQSIYSVLARWVFRLKLFSFRKLSNQQQVDMIKEYIVFFFQNGFDLKEAIYKDLDLFLSAEAVKKRAEDFLNAVIRSQAFLGDAKDKFMAAKFLPTVTNWISEYRASINKKSLNFKPGAFEFTSFMQSNRNVKFLTSAEKEVLRGILELYNWLSNPEDLINSKKNSSEQTFQKDNTYVSFQNFKLPIKNTEQSDFPAQNKFLKTITDIKSPNAQALKTQSILPKKDNLDLSSSKSPGIKLFSENPPEAVKPSNIQPKPAGQLSDNLVKDLNSIQKEIALKKSLAQAEIQKKLTKLKDRNK